MLSFLKPLWWRDLTRQTVLADLLAGLMVSILVIPQSLAYALLAGLPPQAGLYASIFPAIAYAFLGSSRVQAVGPVAITAIMTLTVLTPLAEPGSADYLLLAASLSLLSGGLLLAGGMLGLGFLSQLLSRPVISGFISGSAILIVFSQVKYLLGIQPAGRSAWAVLETLFFHFSDSHALTVAIGLFALLLLVIARYFLAGWLVACRIGRTTADFIVRLVPLLVVLGGTLLVAHWGLDGAGGVETVGQIHPGLPAPVFFLPTVDSVRELAIPALLMAIIGMVQGISMAQALAIKRQERIDANAELRGLGLANIVAAFHGGMPVGGGVSRSAINVAAGAASPLASVLASLFMILIVAGAATWFEHLPLTVLAASIMVAAVNMIDLGALRQAWEYDRADAAALLGTAVGVVFLGLDVGIGLGMFLSLATLLLRASAPHIAVIGRIADSEHFRNVERHAVETIPGVLLLRIDESLFFGNLSAVEARLALELQKAPATREVVLIMSAVNRIDTTAMAVLIDINRELAAEGRRLHLAEVKGPVWDRLQRSLLPAALSGQVFLSVNAAFDHFKRL